MREGKYKRRKSSNWRRFQSKKEVLYLENYFGIGKGNQEEFATIRREEREKKNERGLQCRLEFILFCSALKARKNIYFSSFISVYEWLDSWSYSLFQKEHRMVIRNLFPSKESTIFVLLEFQYWFIFSILIKVDISSSTAVSVNFFYLVAWIEFQLTFYFCFQFMSS